MIEAAEQAILDFSVYPPIDGDDWRYAFETARIRAMETKMLSKATLLDMANAASFEQAADLLTGTEYALGATGKNSAEMEAILREQRSAVRQLFAILCLDRPIVELFKSRADFANLRLGLRRVMTEKPLGADYSSEGNVQPELFEEVFEQENYELLAEYMRQAVEQAVLRYYQKKDIRQIDYAIDSVQAEYNLKQAKELKSLFLEGLFKIQIDLTNIRTMFRLKFTDSEQRNVFLKGGFLEIGRLRHGLDIDMETIGRLFFVTPYFYVIEAGVSYLASKRSFMVLEQKCDEFLTGFLRTANQITAGPGPIIAYLLLKEHEIRTIRLILTGKRNSLDTGLILDRLGE